MLTLALFVAIDLVGTAAVTLIYGEARFSPAFMRWRIMLRSK
jgi:hypothetical protein